MGILDWFIGSSSNNEVNADEVTNTLNQFTSQSLSESAKLADTIQANLANLSALVETEYNQQDRMGEFIDGLETNSDDEFGNSSWWPFW
jgi:hypothetical protein